RHRVDLIEFLAQSVDHKHPMPVFFNRPLVGIHQPVRASFIVILHRDNIDFRDIFNGGQKVGVKVF
ncbi:hypothetical protein ACFFJN_02630, partial [Erwinia mallotivora]|uniref:hypothetical protein n=1 Tax=Erwinia mallotivora TaxID=69222 RepID=UPI0035E671ED